MADLWCIADFCLVPVCAPEPSVAKYIAAVTSMLQDCGLSSELHASGTVLEGPWNKVMDVIGRAHQLVHDQGVVRIQTTVKIGTRTDKQQHFADKVGSVLAKLSN